jgi:hypothetical protein
VLCVTLCKLSVPLPGRILEPLELNEDTRIILILIFIMIQTSSQVRVVSVDKSMDESKTVTKGNVCVDVLLL